MPNIDLPSHSYRKDRRNFPKNGEIQQDRTDSDCPGGSTSPHSSGYDRSMHDEANIRTQNLRIDLPLTGMVLDLGKGDLRDANGKRVELRPQAFQVLRFLAQNAGRVVTKDELHQAVWPDTIVTDDSLVQAVGDLRRVLGDADHNIIKTVPRRGYEMVADAVSHDEVTLQATAPGDTRGKPDVILHEVNSMGLEPLDQTPIRFTTSGDGIRLAWTASGAGLPMLKAPSWISNIEMEARSLIFTEFYRWLGESIRLIRFDQRGTSLSDSVNGELCIDDIVEDMRAVADAAGLERFLLFGPSQGLAFAIAFAYRYPDRVMGIIGRGGFGRGWLVSDGDAGRRKYEGSKALIEAGWNDSNPEYRRFFTARLIPDCRTEVAREFDQMQSQACDTSAILANLELMVNIDVEEIAKTVCAPTLLLHSSADRSVSVTEGRRLASFMPNAEFVVLDDENHIFLPNTIGYHQATKAIENFLSKFKVP